MYESEMTKQQHTALRTVLDSERLLLTPQVRNHRARLEELLDPEFVEISVEGVVRDHTQTIDAVVEQSGTQATTTMHDESAERIGDDLILVQWRSERDDRSAIRTSLWRLSSSGWQILRHQGTPIA